MNDKIFFNVTEKNDDTRKVSVRIDDFNNMLGYVWGERQGVVENLTLRQKPVSDCFFLSRKGPTYQLQAKSIRNYINLIFKELRIPGSAHRLRAAFIEAVVRKSSLRSRAANGAFADRANVEVEGAEAGGHKSFLTTSKYYTNRLNRERDSIEGDIFVTEDKPLIHLHSLLQTVDPHQKQLILAAIEALVASIAKT